MPSRVWKSEDLFNLLRAIYATKITMSETDDSGKKKRGRRAKETTYYNQGCRLAIKALLLAFGFPPQSFLDLEPQLEESRGGGRQVWMRQDIQNIVTSIYLSVGSMIDLLPETKEAAVRYRGFRDILVSFLQSVGLTPDLLVETQEELPGETRARLAAPRHWQLEG